MDYSTEGITIFLETGTLKNWVHQYLAGWGNNSRLSWELANKKTFFFGPKNISLSLIKRTCGVAREEYREDVSVWSQKVMFLRDVYNSGQCLPPLLVGIEKGDYFLYDGNHRHYLLCEAGITQYPCIVACHNFSDLFDAFLCVKQDFLFTVLDNQFVVSRQIDLLAVLLEKELAPYFDVQKVRCPDDLRDISIDTSSRKPRILLRNYDFSIPPSCRCIQVNFFMPNILHGFDVADGIIDSVIKHSFI